ncbi:MAG TPA: 5-(carboxyamino)imidazole ribonucleotide mutase [Candidatus Polarisedimenticolia bacterium]|jgi:phosphoribosylaminoimidazole carboxylase PurE protein
MSRTPAEGRGRVGIVMGSDSDLPVMREAAKVLSQFGVEYELTVASAHRSPERAARYARTAAERGLDAIIAGAGGAAHLAGVLAAGTTVPVIAVPLASSPLAGFDALLSSVQMPLGVPVAVMSVGPWGAHNAGLFAVQIIARRVVHLRAALVRHKRKMAAEVEVKARAVSAETEEK